MSGAPYWDAAKQMPPGREVEAYHFTSTTVQPRVMHSHEYYEIFFFLSGDVRIVIEDMDLRPRRGDVLIFPPHCMHRNTHLSADEPYERFYIYATRAFVQGVAGEGFSLEDELSALTRDCGQHFHLGEKELGELMRMTDEAIRASQDEAPSARLMNACRMGMLLLRTAQLLRRSTQQQRSVASRMNPLLRYLNDHVTQDVSLDHLADTFYISKYALLREFKEYTGMPIHQYILAKRILMAQELIAGGMKPNQVAERCGFADYTSFYRAFRGRTGVSPNQFARERR